MPLRARQTSRNKTLRHLRGEKTSVICSGFIMVILFLSCRNLPRPETEEQCRTRQRVQSYCGFTVCQRSVRRASPLPTTTRRARCFQVRDVVDPAKQDGVVCRIPCECGKVYIGGTGRPMQDRIKEHDRDIRLARTETSAVSEHAHNTEQKPL